MPHASSREIGSRYVVGVLAKTPGNDHACDDGSDQEDQPAYHSDPVVVAELRELDSGIYAETDDYCYPQFVSFGDNVDLSTQLETRRVDVLVVRKNMPQVEPRTAVPRL